MACDDRRFHRRGATPKYGRSARHLAPILGFAGALSLRPAQILVRSRDFE